MKTTWEVWVVSSGGLPDDYYTKLHRTRRAAVAEARRLVPGAIIDGIEYIRVDRSPHQDGWIVRQPVWDWRP